MARSCWPTAEQEYSRYLLHQNKGDDPGYRAFLEPLVKAALSGQKKNDQGLDFGSGPTPLLSQQLRACGFQMDQYDPFFFPAHDALEKSYDFICCCEVIEHFHSPHKEFSLLKKLCRPQGTLYIRTSLCPENTDLSRWHYISDSSHTFIYSRRTIEWIASTWDFKPIQIDSRLIILSNQHPLKALPNGV